MQFSLDGVKKTYRAWGQHPHLYKLGCAITFLGRESKLRRHAVEALGLDKGDTVLDLACGTGLNFPFLEDAVGPQGNIIAFDYSDEMLSAARRRADENRWTNIAFMQGDAARMTLDTKVDGVLSTLGISAIPQHTEALENASSALKDDGRIAILDARLPTGVWSVFRPLIAIVYRYGASWDPAKDIVGDLKRIMGNATTECFNGGTIYITSAIKSSS